MRPCSARTTRAAHLGIMWGTGRIGNAFCATSNPFLRYLFSIDQLFLVVLSGWLAQPTSSFCTGYILSRELCKDQLYLIGATHELLRIVPEINPSKYSLGLQHGRGASHLSTGNHLQMIQMDIDMDDMDIPRLDYQMVKSLGTRGVSTHRENPGLDGRKFPIPGLHGIHVVRSIVYISLIDSGKHIMYLCNRHCGYII